jgi:hypothetical protein
LRKFLFHFVVSSLRAYEIGWIFRRGGYDRYDST